ncbi:hypothetical protein [Beijerinckia mobilis]|uniref:hypothetical protein n=1 Tax=Beijerinckia mobilis TaxID=231434 RepID=UPI0005531F60|nr:hypothetical protein [Beijerinckia mobilis]
MAKQLFSWRLMGWNRGVVSSDPPRPKGSRPQGENREVLNSRALIAEMPERVTISPAGIRLTLNGKGMVPKPEV